MNTDTTTETDIIYPDSDGMPMADNTLQYQWIVTIMGNLDALFASNPNVFVAGDNLIYPVKGNNAIRSAPDVYVAFGRPKGHRGSYRVWEEGGIFPQVIFEVLSPGNRAGEMSKKRQFYRIHGAEEYYVIDPDENTVEGWIRDGNTFREVEEMEGFKSPRLGIRFSTSGGQLALTHPDGQPFRTFQEIVDRAASAEREVERLRAMLRASGLDPDKPAG